jgi:hypothetical protein
MRPEQPTPRLITTVFDVENIINGECLPLSNAGFKTRTEAVECAEKRARSLGLPVIFLDWRQDIKNATGDGVFVCEIRRDQAQHNWPRVFA